jgi:DNA-binding CsgD family transcriptional regulator
MRPYQTVGAAHDEVASALLNALTQEAASCLLLKLRIELIADQWADNVFGLIPVFGGHVRGVKGDRLGGLAQRFYEVAVQPTLWREVLAETADALGADGAAVFSDPFTLPSVGLHCSERVDELLDWVQRQGAALHNPRPERALARARPGQAVTESDLFTDWELRNLPFNVGMADDVGLRWDAGGSFDVAGQPVFLTVQREGHRERFQRAELEALEALFPHVRRAAFVAVQMAQLRALGMLDAYTSVGCGAILLDYLGRPLKLNALAEALCGEALRIERGYLVATDQAANRELQRVIGAALAPAPLGKHDELPVAALPRPGGRGILAQGMPVAGALRDIFQEAKAIVLLTDADAGPGSDEMALRELFKLTPAEARVASAIGLGHDLPEIATRLSISIGTARAHLKSVMAKTDTHRQAELAVLVARLGRYRHR